ncbi:MAG: polysaccharide lyase [Pseudomonadota bacterium]
MTPDDVRIDCTATTCAMLRCLESRKGAERDMACENGFTTRYMPRDGGRAALQPHLMDKAGSVGDGVEFKDAEENGANLAKSVWQDITECLLIDDHDERDGAINVWRDGERVADVGGLRFVDNGADIDRPYFGAFFGGDDLTWLFDRDFADRLRHLNDHCVYSCEDKGAARINTTPQIETNDVLARLEGWASNRCFANIACQAAIGLENLVEAGGHSVRHQLLRDFSTDQLDYKMDKTPDEQICVLDFGDDLTLNPHHDAASGITNIGGSNLNPRRSEVA